MAHHDSEAEIPACLKYLAGCKYFKPTGRWVLTLGGWTHELDEVAVYPYNTGTY